MLIYLSGHPNFAMTFQRPSLLTVSKVLLLGFLLKLLCSKNHIHCASASSKATLTLWDGQLRCVNTKRFEMSNEPVEKYTGKDFPSNGEKGDATMVVKHMKVPFPLVQVRD